MLRPWAGELPSSPTASPACFNPISRDVKERGMVMKGAGVKVVRVKEVIPPSLDYVS